MSAGNIKGLRENVGGSFDEVDLRDYLLVSVLDDALSADGAYSGYGVSGTAGEALSFGHVVVYDVATGYWKKADANSAAGAAGDARGLIGFCVLAAAGSGSSTKILLRGFIRADSLFATLTGNGPVFVSETAGEMVQTPPSTTDAIIRCLGSARTADSVYVNPSPDYFVSI